MYQSKRNHTTECRPKGGITVAINKKYQVKISNTKKPKHTIAMKLQFDSVCIFIIAEFFPPQTDVYEILSDITDAIPSQVNIPSLLYGDFNCRLKITGDIGSQLLDMLEHLDLHCMSDPTVHTYHAPNGKSVVDLFIANPDLVNSMKLSIQASNVRKHHRVLAEVTKEKCESGTFRFPALRRLD